MSHVLFCTSCFFFPLNSFHTRELSWLCQSFSVYIQTTCISHNPALLSLHAACLLVKAEWITGWSHRGVMWLVEMILHRERTVVQDDNIVIFFFFVWTWCIVVPLFIPSRPSGGGSQGCEEQDGVENLFLSLQWERENETEREKVLPSVLPSAFFPPTPPRPRPRGCCNADRWARGERRGGFNWSGISGDQSVYWSVIRSSEWVQPLLSPTPPTSPPPPHFNTYQSSRTCRQRCPPLALHCQRMMQQRHRRWPPPCTEGGGVTGAK